jgi:hypothetical protein
MAIWYIFYHFGMLHQEKSGNPVPHQRHSAILDLNLCANLAPMLLYADHNTDSRDRITIHLIAFE